MTPMQIIQQFQLDISTDVQDFLIAADCAEENGLLAFAQFLRGQHASLRWRDGQHADLYRGTEGDGIGFGIHGDYGVELIVRYARYHFQQAFSLNAGYGSYWDYEPTLTIFTGSEGYGESETKTKETIGYGDHQRPYYRDEFDGAGQGAGIGYGMVEEERPHAKYLGAGLGHGGRYFGGYGEALTDGSGHSHGMSPSKLPQQPPMPGPMPRPDDDIPF